MERRYECASEQYSISEGNHMISKFLKYKGLQLAICWPRFAKSRVSIDEEFKHVLILKREELNGRIMEAFKLYIQLMTLVVGGCVYLSIMPNGPAPEKLHKLATLADGLVGFVTFIALVMVLENVRGWFGYRKAQSRLGGLDLNGKPHIPWPRKFRASLLEGVMMLGMVVAAVGFYYFNPLKTI